MFKIQQNSIVGASSNQIEAWKDEFDKSHCVVLPSILDDALMEKILTLTEGALFFENQHTDKHNEIFAKDLSIAGKNKALHYIHLLFNNKVLFELVEKITGIQGIKGFSGRIYRNLPNSEHRLDWHDDTEDSTRLIGMSMSLNRNEYAGGTFQIRDAQSRGIIKEVGAGLPGDTHLFRVSPFLQHRVCAVTGVYPRTAAAGWFTSEPFNVFQLIK